MTCLQSSVTPKLVLLAAQCPADAGGCTVPAWPDCPVPAGADGSLGSWSSRVRATAPARP